MSEIGNAVTVRIPAGKEKELVSQTISKKGTRFVLYSLSFQVVLNLEEQLLAYFRSNSPLSRDGLPKDVVEKIDRGPPLTIIELTRNGKPLFRHSESRGIARLHTLGLEKGDVLKLRIEPSPFEREMIFNFEVDDSRSFGY